MKNQAAIVAGSGSECEAAKEKPAREKKKKKRETKKRGEEKMVG